MSTRNATSLDVEHLRSWIGHRAEDEDVIGARHARLMAATIGVDPQGLANGRPLPPLWHWLYFLDGLPEASLGIDGHARRGGFLPPVPLAHRMWAGGRLAFAGPGPRIGETARRVSSILDVRHKAGRTGDLVFVTVLHEIQAGGRTCIREEHDIVYRDGGPAAPAPAAAVPPPGEYVREVTPSAVMLFRYSALTFNGHRIHYDADYAREEEGYAGPVIHGPLNATLLAGFAMEVAGASLGGFSYRGHAPATLGQTMTMYADRTDDGIVLSMRFADGRLCMSAQATAAGA